MLLIKYFLLTFPEHLLRFHKYIQDHIDVNDPNHLLLDLSYFIYSIRRLFYFFQSNLVMVINYQDQLQTYQT